MKLPGIIDFSIGVNAVFVEYAFQVKEHGCQLITFPSLKYT